MQSSASRRQFLQTSTATAALGLGGLGFLDQLAPVSAAEAKLPTDRVRLHPDIEPLVRLLEETPRDRVIEEFASRVRRGTSYREVLAALQLAGVRSIQPRPVGFKFHAVLVVNSAHLASLNAPDSDRWLPIFWALDQFKGSQARNVQEGNWKMANVAEASVPAAHRAKAAFTEAMDNWDTAAADAAVAGLARSSGAQEVFELFARYGARDFRDIGHKAIYVANSWRTLQNIGWQHAEPVLRSLAYALLEHEEGLARGKTGCGRRDGFTQVVPSGQRLGSRRPSHCVAQSRRVACVRVGCGVSGCGRVAHPPTRDHLAALGHDCQRAALRLSTQRQRRDAPLVAAASRVVPPDVSVAHAECEAVAAR
jgi:hypothetical protein